MKPNYYIIPIITVLTALFGGWLMGYGLDWYNALILPEWAPSGIVLSLVWMVLYASATLAALMMWNVMVRDEAFAASIVLLVFNILLNVLWPATFFWLQSFGLSLWVAVLLLFTTSGLIVALWGKVRSAALLFIPYAVWVGFGVYLTYVILTLN